MIGKIIDKIKDLFKSAGEWAETRMDEAERDGRLEVLVAIGLVGVAFYVLADDAAPFWLIVLGAVWPGRSAVRLRGHLMRAWRAWEDRRPTPPPRTLEEVTLQPLPDPTPPDPPPSFAPRRP